MSESILSQGGSTLVDETSTKYFKASDGSFYRMTHSSSSGITTYARISQDSFPHSVKIGDFGNLACFRATMA